MTSPRYAALASKVLVRAQRDTIDSPSVEDRAEAILRIERAIRRTSRRRFTLRSLSAAAAVALLGLGAGRYVMHRAAHLAAIPASSGSAVTVVGHPMGGGATIVQGESQTSLADGTPLAPGSRILTHSDGRVALALSTGSQLTVDEGGDVSIVQSDSSQVFAVHAGALGAHVAKLDARQRFIIKTPDSEVEVRGTSFHVAIADSDPSCGEGTVTRVSVDEGVVSVRHGQEDARVAAGQTWPSGCAPKVSAPTVARPVKGGIAAAPSHAPAGNGAPAAADAPLSASDLGEQNDSFARALAAKRRGATAEALEDFESFVARYPSSPLVESALAQRMQILRGVDPVRASAAADQYLARYPRGFARSEAESIKRQTP